ncbi:hypothetical protein ACRALDRAFT_2038159 [Sodiomyces alcalophilus JCM 7366]|uniref:uncharacterized protein n=1 Tax=Sodiomyces alcalophilus JCM 7366 TaxID=591952 RepID=UPI0039B4F34B
MALAVIRVFVLEVEPYVVCMMIKKRNVRFEMERLGLQQQGVGGLDKRSMLHGLPLFNCEIIS